METVLGSVFKGEMNEKVHSDFVKFSRGLYKNRYLADAKKQKDGWSIKTGPEYANSLVRACLEKTSGKVKITGSIISTFDVKSKTQIPVENVKKFMGIQQAVVNTETEPGNILALMDEFPRAFFALSFETGTEKLKIKPKAPKSAKPAATGEKEPRAEFCSIKTGDSKIADGILFGATEAKEIAIKHEITISDIELPKEVSDPAMIREKSKRRGTIKRIITADGKRSEKEAKFFA